MLKEVQLKMKPFGVIRKVDELGRIVLPAGLRKKYNIQERDSLEIFTEDDAIVLRKYEPGDIFTGEMEELIEYEGKKISKKTIRHLYTTIIETNELQ